MSTYAKTFSGSQTPWVDPDFTQTTAALNLVSGAVTLAAQSTSDIVTIAAGSFDKNQSIQLTYNYVNDISDLYTPDNHIYLLYTDANNNVYVYFDFQGGTQPNLTPRLVTTIAGTVVDVAFSANIDSSVAANGDTLKLDATWVTTTAGFSIFYKGSQIGATINKTAFGLTSGRPGWKQDRPASTRQITPTTITATGYTAASGGGQLVNGPLVNGLLLGSLVR